MGGEGGRVLPAKTGDRAAQMTRNDFMDKWAGTPCPGCGKLATDIHHVHKRRIKKYEKELYDYCNVCPACNSCNTNETWDFQVACSLFIFRELQFLGYDNPPKAVVDWDENGPWIVKGLPTHFWEAERLWRKG